MTKETAKLLEALDTELGELGEALQDKLDATFQEEYDVRDVMIDAKGLIIVTIDLLEDVDED